MEKIKKRILDNYVVFDMVSSKLVDPAATVVKKFRSEKTRKKREKIRAMPL